MGCLIDLAGQKFGRLAVLRKADAKSKVGALWLCLCDCGTQATVPTLKLRSGLIKSCGCYRAEMKANLRHGHANKSKTYRTWKEMRQRCMNQNADQWQWYGGRGISICERWSDFESFLADMGERPEGTTIDRIGPDGNYEPDNCRWATGKQQALSNRGVIRKGVQPHNKISEGELRMMLKMRDGGAKLAQIAAATGRHISSVCTALRSFEKTKGAAK